MTMVAVLAVIQARMTSERLPGKVLADLIGRPILDHVVSRTSAAATVDAVVVATSGNPADDPVVSLATEMGADVVRGDEADVLSRFVAAVHQHRPEVVVRVTGDCPLVDPEVIDLVVRCLVDDTDLDYTSNVHPRTYPRGLDVEAIRATSLLEAFRLADTDEEREHVTFGIHTRHAERFRLGSVTAPDDDSDLRWTVDYPEDLEVLRTAAEALNLGQVVPPYREVVSWFRSHPDVATANAHRATWTPG